MFYNKKEIALALGAFLVASTISMDVDAGSWVGKRKGAKPLADISKMRMIEGEGKTASIEFHPSNDRPYAGLKWFSQNKCGDKPVAQLTAHTLTKNDPATMMRNNYQRFAHDHVTLYVADENCKIDGIFDVTFGHKENQVQINQDAELVLMRGSDLLMFDQGIDKWCKMVVDPETMNYKCSVIPWTDIHISNALPPQRGYFQR